MTKKCKACSRTFNPLQSPYQDYGPSCGKRAGATPLEGREHLVAKIDVSQDDANQEYFFARKSEFENVGEDLKGSKRHQWHENNSLEEAEENGQGEKYAQRDNYLKKSNLDFLDGINEKNCLNYLMRYFIIKKFPPSPAHELRYESFYSKAQSRKDYLESFDWIIKETEALKNEGNWSDIVNAIKAKVSEKYKRHDDHVFNAVRGQMRDHYWLLFSTYKKSGLGQMVPDFDGVDEATRLKNIKELIASGKLSLENKERKTNDKTIELTYTETVERKGKEIPYKTYEEQVDFLHKEVGFRGIQWGQYITDSERKEHAKHLCEAVTDLSEVLGVPPSKLSFGGAIGIAVGARGSGKASAHYENQQKVINLTKGGAGALAHEFIHAIDNMIGEKVKVPEVGKSRGCYEGRNVTSLGVYRYTRPTPEIEEIQNLAQAFRKALDPFQQRMVQVINDYNAAGANIQRAKFDYFVNNNQELFARVGERIIQKRLERAGKKNTYLAGAQGSTIWPTDEELKTIEPAFDALLGVLKKYW